MTRKPLNRAAPVAAAALGLAVAGTAVGSAVMAVASYKPSPQEPALALPVGKYTIPPMPTTTTIDAVAVAEQYDAIVEANQAAAARAAAPQPAPATPQPAPQAAPVTPKPVSTPAPAPAPTPTSAPVSTPAPPAPTVTPAPTTTSTTTVRACTLSATGTADVSAGQVVLHIDLPGSSLAPNATVNVSLAAVDSMGETVRTNPTPEQQYGGTMYVPLPGTIASFQITATATVADWSCSTTFQMGR